MTEGYRNIQVTLCLQQTAKLILEDFDLACCQVMFNGSLEGTDAFVKVMQSGWKENLSTKKIPIDRISKYERRGVSFPIVCDITEPLNQKYVSWSADIKDTLSSLREYCPAYKYLTFPLPIPDSNWMNIYTGNDEKIPAWGKSPVKEYPQVLCVRPDDSERIMVNAEFVVKGLNRSVYKSSIQDMLLERAKAIMMRYISSVGICETEASDHLTFSESTHKDILHQVDQKKTCKVSCLVTLENKVSKIDLRTYFSTLCTGCVVLSCTPM